MRDTAIMVNGFDMESVDALDPELRKLVERRARLLGPAYKLFYAKPVRFVRAEGVYLFDADGQAYLDAYNNVPSVGHCHPRVVAAIARQAATLNTHTRYASELILDYAERLLATYPAGLGHVMFTCTGSEAVDLALRVARFRTGGEGVVITANAYHGVTTAAAEISPSLGPAVPLGRAAGTPRISAVRGAGLYLAADFVHPDTGEPDGDTALRVVNGLRERRVLISATGPHGHTLKIRPPLPFSRADADRLAESLTDTLRTL